MASTTSPEASEIRRRGRRRLLGAVTLVLLAVVFIPMILDNEPRTQRTEPSLAIPPKENVAPLPPPTPQAVAESSSRTPQAGANSSSPTPQAAADSSSPSPSPQAAADSSSRTPQGGDGPGPNSKPAKVEPAPAAAKVEPVVPPTSPAKAAPQPRLEGFAVQVGAFRDEARLKQARAKLEAAHVVHYTERIEASGGTMTRLRAGPFPTREAAEKARAKLQQGQVVPLP